MGFNESEVNKIVSELNATSTIKVIYLFSHLAASEDLTEKDFSESQISTFKTIAKNISNKLSDQPKLHMSNTSGILNYPDAQFDMVRSGIGLYGFSNIPEEQKNFTPIASLKSVISQIHTVKKGDSVGYNRAFKSGGAIVTATIPIGHADGISRAYGNGKGWVMVQGVKAPIIGNVCMDMMMINITGIVCKEGDEAIIFGKQNKADTLAENIESISYELLTAISQRVKRVVYRK